MFKRNLIHVELWLINAVFFCLPLLGVSFLSPELSNDKRLNWNECIIYGCRFDTLEPEMNNLGARVTDVNQVAEQLLSSDNRNKDQIHQTRDQLNNRSEQTYKVSGTRINIFLFNMKFWYHLA